MDLIQAILDVFTGINSIDDNVKKNDQAGYILTISAIISIALFFLSADLFSHQKINLILIALIILSVILSFGFIYMIIHFRICKPANFWNFVAYLLSLILILSSIGFYIIKYFRLFT
ncbi:MULTISPECIES: hypothetical protein [unclassified Empedobacter]|uniref:hypothetical protein n=1 Tax=unclassified Empedobacter TaxID=2643773 RepID=UPI0025C1ED70|nr:MULTISPECIES: hypothetical protein [unclassified Empedobacter]